MNNDLNLSDLEPQFPMPTHSSPSVFDRPNFRFKPAPSVLAKSSPTGKWCEWCVKDTHNDADCWSTRAG